MTTFNRAIVRPPGPHFADGLTTVDLGTPIYELALQQHADYCAALKSCGLEVEVLPVDDRYPDSTFVEDTAVLTARCAVITRPGAESRLGEVPSIEERLRQIFGEVRSIRDPGTVDGGDICEAGNHFFIGISARTNEAGAEQLAKILADYDYTSDFIDIRNLKNILHLKSGLAYLSNRRLIVINDLVSFEQFSEYELIEVNPGENYAANCVLINDKVLIPQGFPLLTEHLAQRGFEMMSLEMSEFEKMDGGLSCLSLRF